MPPVFWYYICMGKNETKKRKTIRWEKLDNTAHVFPVIAGEGMTNVYRISVTLTEEIKPDLLQKALDILLPKMDGFNVRMRRGVFWYYFEENGKPAPPVNLETNFPCRYIRANTNRSYLFRVTYYECRINLEVFHVLADGMGGINFLKELTYQYLRLAHEELGSLDDSLSGGTSLNQEDAFVKHYRKSKPSGFNKQKSYHIKLEKLPRGEFGLMHGYMSVTTLKAVAKKYGASINEYLVALFAWSTYQVCLHGMPSKEAIRVAVPVNLRSFFESSTTRNFFVMVSAEFIAEKEEYTFEDVLEIIKTSLRNQISKDKLEDLFSYSVSNQMRPWMRAVPLFLKNIVIKLVYEKSAMANTTTITNIGNMSVDDVYKPYVKQFYACIAMSKGQSLKGTVCSYDDTLVFTFSSIFADTSIQRCFFRQAIDDGIEVAVETNGVYE